MDVSQDMNNVAEYLLRGNELYLLLLIVSVRSLWVP